MIQLRYQDNQASIVTDTLRIRVPKLSLSLLNQYSRPDFFNQGTELPQLAQW